MKAANIGFLRYMCSSGVFALENLGVIGEIVTYTQDRVAHLENLEN